MVLAVGTAASNESKSPYMIAAFVNQMIQLRYSRNDESEADEWGIQLMSAAGFDPRAMIDVMKVLKEASGSGGGSAEIFQTHPNPDLRIEQIQDYLLKHPSASQLSKGRSLQELYQKSNQ